jgi:hypothetical protein
LKSIAEEIFNMKIKQITASYTAFPEMDRKGNGKEMFLSATACPDAGEWSLAEAEVNFFRLFQKLYASSQMNMLVLGMVSKESYDMRVKKNNGVYDMLIIGSEKKLGEKDEK